MIELIKKIPKAELHLHIEGSLEPELMFKLSKKNNVALPYQSVKEIRAAYQFQDLQSFLDIYYQGAAVLIHEQDFYDLTWEYIEKSHADNVRHVEIFFDPQTHTQRGVKFETPINGISRALDDAQNKYGISSKIIPCFLRHLSEKEALETFEQAMDHRDKICAFGLDSAEKGHPPEKFQRVFDKVLNAGFKTVAHAGEEGPAEYIWQAIELLKVERIDHGVRCLEDAKLVEYLKANQLPLTVCPYSNVKLKVFEKLEDHNLSELLKLGLKISLNADDPAYFGGYLNDNYIGTQQALNLKKEDIMQLAKNSFTSSFLNLETQKTYIKEIDSLNDV